MSQRPGIQITTHLPVDGGEHPNRYLPYVSAHVRTYWPAHADIEVVKDAMNRAHERALEEVERKMRS
jgi:hypothetical protein